MSALLVALLVLAVGGPVAAVLALWWASRRAPEAPDVLEWMDPPPAHRNKGETKLWK